jgi:hypothetical protein
MMTRSPSPQVGAATRRHVPIAQVAPRTLRPHFAASSGRQGALAGRFDAAASRLSDAPSPRQMRA